jgi:inhibitor of KinA
MFPFELLPAGDSAILVQLEQRIDPSVNAWCIELAHAVEQRLGPSVLDVVVGYCSVTTYFDPLRIDTEWLEREIAAIAAGVSDVRSDGGALVEIPVCYGGEFGPDLPDVARFAGCSEDEVVSIHASRTYRVYLVGFVPGFAYLAEVDSRIAAPRRPAPRTVVPPGSVAIAGGQTGVYPSATPGGWNIIGRTPLKPYDPSRTEPFLLHAGDEVRFRQITVSEFRNHPACRS